jgi:hypothetical protein
MGEHKFLRFSKRLSGNSRVLRDCAVAILNFHFAKNWSRSRWLKVKPSICKWWYEREGKREDKESQPMSLSFVERQLEVNGQIEREKLNLREMHCEWLDHNVVASTNFHWADEGGDAVTLNTPLAFGATFPISPKLDREGRVFTTLQVVLQKSLLAHRTWLVANSHQFDSDEWLSHLRSFIGDAVSLVDMTLHQIYLKAEYAPKPAWRFERADLGERHGRRLADKLKWVFKITGNHLEDTDVERQAFETFRQLRNHLQHFDPPCFCYTLEDVERWLNLFRPLCGFLWRIRNAVGSPMSELLIQSLLEPDVEFVPSIVRPRRAQGPETGYQSSCWPLSS